MASRTTDKTAAETLAEGRPADTDEAAKKGAEGIRDEQQDEKGQRMSRPEGLEKAKDQRAQAPAEGDAAADPAKGTAGASKATAATATTEKTATLTEAEKGTGPAASDADAGDDVDAAAYDDSADVLLDKEPPAKASGVAEGAGAVISAGLGVVSLTGSWLGTVAGARESLIGQLQTSRGASVGQQMQQVYGDQWHAIALVGGVFALLALIVGVVVLAKPAFGAPGEAQAPWIKSVSWAGVVLGVIGLLLAVLKFSDALLGLPSVGS